MVKCSPQGVKDVPMIAIEETLLDRWIYFFLFASPARTKGVKKMARITPSPISSFNSIIDKSSSSNMHERPLPKIKHAEAIP